MNLRLDRQVLTTTWKPLSLSECVGDYKSAGVVSDVQLYLGLLVCANGKTGGSIRYHVSRTTVASCATDMAQYGIL